MKSNFKRIFSIGCILLLSVMMFAGCGSSSASDTITVVSREDGSGTRGAFIELFGIETKNDDGSKTDNTVSTAEISNSTSVVLTTVAGNPSAIGYVSLGSLNDTVKALKIDGVEATVANVENGTYKIQRPFNIVLPTSVNEQAQNFIDYIMSTQGQKVVEEQGYIPIASTTDYTGSGLSGKITVAGSSSVTPLMEALKEAYQKLNPDMEIEIQQSDSTSGVTAAQEGIADIGMASRELKDSEKAKGVTSMEIAKDGLAVIVNKDNSVSDLSTEQVKDIYTGTITDWSQVK